jgi:hypothetical protein
MLLVALTLAASACTSSAGAEDDALEVGSTSLFSSDEASIARLVENFFRAVALEEEYAVFAMFTPHDGCKAADIAVRLPAIDTGVSPESDLEVSRVKLREVGTSVSISFDLVEKQGTSVKELSYEEFFPVVFDGTRWRFDADLCLWVDEPPGAADGEIRDVLLATVTAAEAFHDEFATYLASANDLRYEVSGLKVVDSDLELSPGWVLWLPGIEDALMLGQGKSGTWYCVALIDAGSPGYGSGSGFEEVASLEGCLSTASVSGW